MDLDHGPRDGAIVEVLIDYLELDGVSLREVTSERKHAAMREEHRVHPRIHNPLRICFGHINIFQFII